MIFFCVQRSCRRFMNSSKKNIPPENTLASVPRRQKSPSSALVDTEIFCPFSCGCARNVALTTPLWGGITTFHAQMIANEHSWRRFRTKSAQNASISCTDGAFLHPIYLIPGQGPGSKLILYFLESYACEWIFFAFREVAGDS